MTDSNFEGELGDRLAEFLGVDVKDMPQFRIVTFTEDSTKKFVFSSEISENNLV